MCRLLLSAVLLLGLPALAGPPEAPAPMAYRLGVQLLSAGRLVQAEQAFRTSLDQEPTHLRSRFQLGVVLARQGRCGESLELLDTLRDWPFFTVFGFMAEGDCALGEGDLEGAVERFEMAVERRPRPPEPHYKLVRAHQELGSDGAAAALAGLEATGRSSPLFHIAHAYQALGTSDFEQARVELAWEVRLSRSSVGRAHGAMLDGRADLLVGRPCHAWATMMPALRISMARVEFSSWRSEAFRRCGEVERAHQAITRTPIARQKATPLLLAVASRVATDRGQLEEARMLLASHPDPVHPEYIASAWYLARASGDSTGVLEAAYEQVRRTQDGDLGLLIPLEVP